MLEGFLLVTPMMLFWVFFSVVVSSVIAVIPGLGGMFAMALMLPLVYSLPTEQALAILVAAIAVNGTANTITSILLGLPGSAQGVATLIDGYPMTQKGEGARAIGAAMTASALGGLIGAVVLIALLPVMRALALELRSPEFFLLIVLALVFMAHMVKHSTTKALIAGLFGVALSFVGLEISTGTTRYTFGQLFLWNGIQIIPLVIGLFAITEMLLLLSKGGSISNVVPQTSARRQLLQGIRDNFTSWRALLVGSITGVVVGAAPGLGSSAGQFLAYAQARKFSREPEKFGHGSVEGIIASDSATNSVDGGALVPTLAFGIPGSPSMALLLAAMLALGIPVGPELLTEYNSLVWLFIIVLIVANIMATTLCLAVAQWLVKVVYVRASLLVPPVLLLALWGAYANNNHIGAVVTAVVAGLVGYAMERHGYPRAVFLIGFVLGLPLEKHFLLWLRAYEWTAAFERPVALVFLAVLVALLARRVLSNLLGRRRGPRGADQSSEEQGRMPKESVRSRQTEEQP